MSTVSQEDTQYMRVITEYLVRPCSAKHCPSAKKCFNYHTSAQKRRPPFKHDRSLLYVDLFCNELCSGQVCPKGDDCNFCHTYEELIYHPAKYKTSWCTLSACKGTLCENAHYGTESARNGKQHSLENRRPTNHLDLEKFKTEVCKIPGQHNPKHCIYYHSSKDRRRTCVYSFELCPEADNDCPNGEMCDKAHNRVEQLYHPDKYKVKFCTCFPYKLEQCDYGEYCSFAHSEKDIKVKLIHKMKKDDSFYLHSFKTVWCPFTTPHDKALCVYAHNWQDYRRQPGVYKYKGTACPKWQSGTFILSYEEGGCDMMNSCDKCHGWKELEYHPENFRIRPCSLGKTCSKMQDCPYFHSFKDKRELIKPEDMAKPFSTPQPVKTMMNVPEIKPNQTPLLVKFSNTYEPPQLEEKPKPKEPVASTDEFVLHRGVFERNVLTEYNKSLLSPFAQPFSIEALKPIDYKIQNFLKIHGLTRLTDKLRGISWCQLKPSLLSGRDREVLEGALNAQKEEERQEDELILEDIACFTGQKPCSNIDLKKYSLYEEFNDLAIKFPELDSKVLPSAWICPLSKRLMHDPVVCPEDGKTYEKLFLAESILSKYPQDDAMKLIRSLKRDEDRYREIFLASKEWY